MRPVFALGLALLLAGVNYAAANGGGIFSVEWWITGQLTKFHCRHIDVNIDSIQQWSGDAADVTLNLSWRATTLARRVIPEAARTRVHCRGQYE